MSLVNELIRSGELPVNAPYSVRILPIPPTNEMIRELSNREAWDAKGRTAHADLDGASPSGQGVRHTAQTTASVASDSGASSGPHYVFQAGYRIGD